MEESFMEVAAARAIPPPMEWPIWKKEDDNGGDDDEDNVDDHDKASSHGMPNLKEEGNMMMIPNSGKDDQKGVSRISCSPWEPRSKSQRLTFYTIYQDDWSMG